MAGRGKLCLGYCNEPLPYRDRVAQTQALSALGGALLDNSGLVVEDFGLADNLMIVHGLDLHGCALVVSDTALADPWRDLAAFETCLRLLGRRR
jgi:nucleoside 2-deoxyribosyltransferase